MTPLMKQYWDIKNLHQDQILLFRMGDFYEMFFEDAKIAAPILGIALTARNKKAQDETPMCGVPHHSIMGPIQKLLAAGHKVALCEQIEDPATAKGLVKRAVTRILTPAMVLDAENMLAPAETRWIACWLDEVMAFVETSTGEAIYFAGVSPVEKTNFLGQWNVAELLVQDNGQDLEFKGVKTLWTELTDDPSQLTLPKAARCILSYLQSLVGVGSQLPPLRPFRQRYLKQHLVMPATAVRALELFQTYLGEQQGSLLHAIDRTKSAAGGRLLRDWLLYPLVDRELIEQRQQRIANYLNTPEQMQAIRERLSRVGDLERRLVKVASPSVNARDLLQLAASLAVTTELIQDLDLQEEFATKLVKLAEQISTTLTDDPPLQLKMGGLIREGISAELDELIRLTKGGQQELFAIESRERESTGIGSLKVRYNQVFGYYIEITNTHSAKVPSHYQRKQTLAGAERYTTTELTELERKVLASQSKRVELEYQIFQALREEVLAAKAELLVIAAKLAELDVVVALAWLALERSYVRPELRPAGEALILKSSRHPVVEQVNRDFVANDIELKSGECFLLTGPNMAGKSTLMRQVALSAILAQMGSYVPAGQASVPIFHRVLTRIGASDQLSLGLSTFMVEMQETAEILQSADKNSLIIVDEIGRGTSTQDGLALAQAILEHLLESRRGYLIFATHFHELTGLIGHQPHLQLGHLLIKEDMGNLRFMHSLVSGVAKKSYGVQVADKAGLPKKVIRRAEQLLKVQMAPVQLSLADPNASETPDLDEEQSVIQRLGQELLDFDVMNCTPMEALLKIQQWQKSTNEKLAGDGLRKKEDRKESYKLN